MPASSTTTIKLPLEPEVREQLGAECERTGRSREAILSDVLSRWARDSRRRQAVTDEIAQFAAAHGGSKLDLDRDLEAASAEFLSRDEHAARR